MPYSTKQLRKAISAIDGFLKKVKVDENLGGVRSKKFFKNLVKGMEKAFDEQIEDFVKGDFFPRDELVRFSNAQSPDSLKDEVERSLNGLVFFVEVDLLFDALFEGANVGGQSFFDKGNIDGVFFLTNKDIIEALRGRQNQLIGQIDPDTGRLMGRGLLDNTTRDHIAGILAKGFEEGLSEFDIKEQLLKKMKRLNPMRAELIAHAEVANAVHSMELEAAQRNGSSQKRWVTSHDPRVTPECRENEDQDWIAVKDTFLSGHLNPPRFPRCRCHLEYLDPPLDQVIWDGN